MRRVLFVVVPVVLMLLGALSIAYRRSLEVPSEPPKAAGETLIEIPDGRYYGGGTTGRQLDISPDGKKIVYVANSDSGRHLFLQVIGEPRGDEIPGTGAANDPAFSPDGRFVAFYSQGNVKKAALDGSGVTVIGKAPPLRGIAWLNADTFILGVVQGDLLRMSGADGKTEPILKAKGIPHLLPNIVPGNKAVLVTVNNGPLENARIALVMLDTGEERTLLETNGFSPRYSPTGHIVFASGFSRELKAVRFDAKKLEVIGSPESVLNVRLSGQGTGGSTDYAFSPTGTLIYTSPREDSVERVFANIAKVDLMQIHVRANWLDNVKRLVP
jgi:hypothetical protein